MSYVKKLVDKWHRNRADYRPGTLYLQKIQHDDWCQLLNGTGPCNCDPDLPAPIEWEPTIDDIRELISRNRR